MTNLQKALKKLLSTKPFYAHFFLNSKIVMDWGNVPTAAAAVTSTGTLFIFNSEFLSKLTPDEIIAVIEHEVLHFLFEHVAQMGQDGNQHVRNIAMDCSINQFISGVPEGCVTVEAVEKTIGKPLKREQTWEYYYEYLLDYKNEMEKHQTLDEHGVEHPDKVEGQRAKAAVNNAAQKAIKASNGNLPKELIQTLASLQEEAKLPWQQILSNFVARATSSTTQATRKKRNRRFGISIPGKKKKRELTLAVCVDSSGSISNEAYTAFMTEIVRIAKLTNATYVIEADCEVHNVEKVKKGKMPEMVRRSMGGTAYQPAITKAMELKVDAIIYMGDFDTSDRPENPRIAFLWVGVGNQPAPADFGEVIRL